MKNIYLDPDGDGTQCANYFKSHNIPQTFATDCISLAVMSKPRA